MKKLTGLFTLLLLASLLWAQQPTGTLSFQNDVDAVITNVVGNLDFSELSTGLLLERTVPWGDPTLFHGQSVSDTNLINHNGFGLLYATLSGMGVNGPALPDPGSTYVPVMNNLNASSDTFPISMLFMDYERFKPYAIDSNLLAWTANAGGGQSLFDVANRPESPYALQRLFVASALYDKAIGTSPSFILPSHLFFSNCNTGGSALLSLSIDLDDGNGYQLASLGQVISAQYSSRGDKRVKIKMKTFDRKEYVAHFSFRVMEQGIGTRFPEVPTDIDIPATQEHSGGVMNIFINDCNDGLTKPLIIADGLDPELRDENRTWEFAIELLGFRVDQSNQLIDILESEGYDIIFLDYNNGGDYIQRNARMVQDALREINQIKAANGSAASNILIGPSMGGPVTEYALLEMEQNNEVHQVEQLLLLDGVQRGANVPLGIQHASRHLHHLEGPWNTPLRDYIPQLSFLKNLFNEPSMKQMLLYSAYSANGVSPLPEHVQFYAELDAFAPPQHFDYVALSAGSLRGVGQLVQPGEDIVSYSGGVSEILQDVVGGWSGFWANTVDFGLGLLGNTATFAVGIRAIPDQNQGGVIVYNGQIEIEILFSSFVSSSYSYVASGTLPLDSAPGGFMGIHRDSVFLNEQQLFHNTVCIVPTVSSLDIPVNAANLYANLENVGSVAGNLTVVNRYAGSTASIESSEYGPPAQENQQHSPIINEDNIDFLLFSFVAADPLLSEQSGVINNRVYNFGRSLTPFNPAIPGFFKETDNRIRYDVDILNGGSLWVNRADRIAFTDELQNPQNQQFSNYNLFIGGGDLCTTPSPVTLTIAPTARMELGQWDAAAGITNTAQVYVQADATVSIQAQGELYINKGSRFIVQEGGYAEVLSDGLLSAGFGGQVRIEKGGEARIGSGGILRVSQDSKCVVEDGGKLVLEPGAIVQLWDGADPFGRAVLEVQGELEVQGSIDFSGNGFFDFFQSHILSLTGGIFRIEGRGIGKRFLRLRNNTTLDIGDNTVELLEGLAEYGNYAKISVGQGEAFISNMELKTGGQTAVGLLANGASKIRFVYNEAYGFANAVEAYNTYPSNALDFLFFQSDFSDNQNAIWLSHGSNARVWDCHFNGTGTGVNAMLLDELQSVRVDASVIENYNVPTEPAYMTWGAVHVSNVGEYIMSGGELSNNDVGLYCPPGKYVNVTLRGQAEVADNDFYGLHIVEGNREGSNYGLVTMDCARLLNNGLAGIKGQNLILNIDAFINSQTDNLAYARSNHFQRGPNDALWFDICYDGALAETINTIPAEGNYWGTDHANPEPGGGLYYYALDKTNFGGCGGFPEINLDFGTKATGAPTSCPSAPPTGPHVPPSKDCSGLMATPTEQLGGSFFDAFFAYQDKLEQEELTETTYPLFADVAQKSNTERGTASDQCKHYIDVARVFVAHTGGQHLQSAGGSPQGIQQRQGIDLSGQPSAFPNPAQNEVAVEWNPGDQFSLRAINAAGQEVWSGLLPSGTHRLPVDSWAEGWYFLHFTTTDGQRTHQLKVMVQR